MARFWDVDSGTVKLGGTDIREYQLDSLMANFSMVFQTVYLFNDTIENNIKFGNPVPLTKRLWRLPRQPGAMTLFLPFRMVTTR